MLGLIDLELGRLNNCSNTRDLFCCNTKGSFCCSTGDRLCCNTGYLFCCTRNLLCCNTIILKIFKILWLIVCFSTTPENAGNLSVKKKAAHINPEPPRASKVTKLERGGHFGQRYLIPVSIRSKLFWGSKSNSLET